MYHFYKVHGVFELCDMWKFCRSIFIIVDELGEEEDKGKVICRYIYSMCAVVTGVMLSWLLRSIVMLIVLDAYPYLFAMSAALTHSVPFLVNVNRLLYELVFLYVSCVQSCLFVKL